MVDLKEITMANGIAILMTGFLLACRRKNRDSVHTEDKIYDGMVLVDLLGALIEIASFYVDSSDIAGGRAFNYITNSLCFMGTSTIGLLWCLYVDLRVYQNYRKTSRSLKILMIPWAVEFAAILCNLLGTGILFTVSQDNVYRRAAGVVIAYVSLLMYLAYSRYLVMNSHRREIGLRFFTVDYFICPCLLGILLQFMFYGISASWVSVAIALMFVQMQAYAENVYRDELSGLFNRRYLVGLLAKKETVAGDSMYGIMMDIDGFKDINDTLGHGEGDRAISVVGDVLLRSMPDGGIAIRYAGDEFMVLLSGADEEAVKTTMDEIRAGLARFNQSGEAAFTLSLSMGYTRYGEGDDTETFLKRMDEKMYEEKRRYHGTN